MSKPKYKWYGAVKKLILCEYYKQDTEQAHKLAVAMEEARKDTNALPNSDLRLKAIDDILINKTRTYEGVGRDMNYDARTIQSWITKYINSVGIKAGW